MYAFQTGDLEKVMGLPVPYRKWLIERWNKQKEKEQKANGQSDPNQPMSQSERMKFIKKAQEVQPNSFMQPMRNKK